MMNFKHVYREGNQEVDQLAKMAMKIHHKSLVKWRNPPGGMDSLLRQDALGLERSRNVHSCN